MGRYRLGLTRWENEAQTWAIYDYYNPTDNDLPPAVIWDYTRAAHGSLWLAFSDELLHAWPGRRLVVLAPLPELVKGTVVRMEAAADDSLWLGTQEPNSIAACPSELELEGTPVYGIVQWVISAASPPPTQQ